ncbi:MAG TPA: flagellar basal body rod protein FlgB [Candidatus Hydrogenedentes bacterium]|nr:flagellar basal body rod protein FlgB [Candidatus Hydrogenedentota bacterium]HOC31432.1 flagellar basal body rod protein FlgB [Armatimonadota bacterium]HNZ18000.1 flagellar basal body rod protein FlgB [Candidatus Hydrogenedentota bacterium]HOH33087.1 flagellar basal body rod protein FlgB [Candidatus Hydrogenedentota bacterium]HPA05873.1 flagellar basal body rod protein FlgB [Candidatus Hydrogenedentota bacterium]
MEPFAGVDVTRVLHNAMRVAATNHRIIANNVANADTPNYNAVRMDFQATLRAALEGRDRVSLRKTQARHLDSVRYLAEFDNLAISSKNDYNKVDLEEEMARLSANTSDYTTYGSLLVKYFQQTRNMLNTLR